MKVKRSIGSAIKDADAVLGGGGGGWMSSSTFNAVWNFDAICKDEIAGLWLFKESEAVNIAIRPARGGWLGGGGGGPTGFAIFVKLWGWFSCWDGEYSFFSIEEFLLTSCKIALITQKIALKNQLLKYKTYPFHH